VPLLDTLSVVVIRLSEGRPIYRGDRCHLSHRLVAAGLSEPQAVKFLLLLTLALGVGALQLANASVAKSLWTIAGAGAIAALVLLGISVHGLLNRGLPQAKSRNPVEGL
jgi:UDP-GlcNAc:undecaprenyl-phosphate GlcNAc-1-phosphate transferase